MAKPVIIPQHYAPCGHALPFSGQQQAVLDALDSGSRFIDVNSKAGTGKTSTLGELACHKVRSDRRVLVLSFTKNGVAEVVRALKWHHEMVLKKSESSESNFAGRNLRVRTFDSMIWNALCDLGLKPSDSAPLEWQVRNLMEIGGNDLLQKGSELGVWTRLNFERKLRDICDLIARSQLLAPDPEGLIMPLWLRLESRCKNAGLALPSAQARIVIDNAFRIAEIVAKSYDIVLVDEVQDCSIRDLSPIIQLVKGEFETQIVGFGDPGQSVMDFRGSVGNVPEKLADLGIRVDHRELTVNRRSTSALVNAQNQLQLAGGWKGPLARSTKERSGGPLPLVALVDKESDLFEINLAFLWRCGLAPERESSLSEALIQRIYQRADFVLENCGERLPLVEVLIPSKAIGKDLASSLQAYDIDFTWIRSDSNPYDSGDAAVLHGWFDFTSDQAVLARNLINRHFSQWRYGRTAEVQGELEACYSTLSSMASALHGCHDRTRVSQELIKICKSGRNHRAVGDAGRGYLDSAERVLRAFERAGRTESIDEALDGLESLFLRSKHNTRSGRDVPTLSARIITNLRETGIAPGSVVGWLDKRRKDWREQRPPNPESGVVIKTPEMAKGDTVDAVLVHRADRVPRPKVFNRLTADSDSSSSSLAQAYIAVSRPRYVYIAASHRVLPRFHETPLSGWDYFDMRSISD